MLNRFAPTANANAVSMINIKINEGDDTPPINSVPIGTANQTTLDDVAYNATVPSGFSTLETSFQALGYSN